MKNVLLVLGVLSLLALSGCDNKGNVMALDDEATVAMDSSVNIDVLANDGWYEAGKVIHEWGVGSHGSVRKETNETLTYTPNDGYSGRDKFSYVLKVGEETDTGYVNVTVTDPGSPYNEPPTVSAGDNRTIEVDKTITITGTDNDTDGNIATREWKEGAKLLARNASFEYTATVVGQHKLIYTVTDDDGASASDDMNVTVTEVASENHAPTADTQTVTLENCEMGSTTTITLVGHDEDDDSLTYYLGETNVDYGEIDIPDANTGSAIFTINDSMAEGNCIEGVSTSFTFKVKDDTAYSSEATVTLNPPS